ncbi:translocation/assembly module TamB domain-containing protein [Pedobacter sp. MC2016-14]|uniref:translocation/assembly module TamB domain-containing protein n=1 Tax=Pedobacter sp. MC2016-14 TaxID=2897327 RepID=UPI001E43A526|nr:translocation/assembly module TamB [Pedobacter sp. MC2016-14]MCD0490444.1 translocation/assembly module TamB domain-containing protein [Pedobacter sp. MC2016-14]
MNKFVRTSLKVILWIIASIIMLVVLIAISLNIPAVQNFVKDKAIGYLKNKTHTEVSLESVKIALPKDVVLNKFYIEDKKGDTLLYAEKLAVDISLLKLLSNKVEINNIQLDKIRANVTRINPDTTFNFSFLVDAFMSEQKKPDEVVEKDSTSTMKFSLNKISLTDIGIVYRDDVAGNDVKLQLGEFKTDIKNFDMEKQHYVINDISLKNTSLSYLQQKPLTVLAAQLEKSIDTAKTESGKLPLVEIEDFSFENVKVNFNDMISKTSAALNLNDLNAANLFIDLTNGIYKAEEAKLNNSKIDFNAMAANAKGNLNINELAISKLAADLNKGSYTLDEAILNKSNVAFAFKPATATKTASKTADTAVTEAPLSLLVGKLSLAENSIKFDNLAAKPTKGMDFNHLQIGGLGLVAEQLAYNATGAKVLVKSAGFKEKSGFQLNQLQGDVVYSDKAIQVKNLVAKTPNTSIENNTQLTYTSLEDLTKHPERVKITMGIKNTTIGLKDGTYFSDAIPASYRNEKIKLNASVSGYMNNLNIPKFQLSGLKSTNIDVSGNIKGLPDINKLYADLTIKRFSLTKSDLLVVIPKNTLPSNIQLPNAISANGKFKGSLTDFNTGFNINTDMGGAKLLATMNGPKGKERYSANLLLNNFNVGRLLKMQPTLGKITVKANVNGTGLDAKKAVAKVNAQVVSAYYNKYTYKNLLLSGTYAAQKLNLKSSMADTNANFSLTAFADIAGKYPAVKADLNLKQVDLQKLNFSTTEFRLAGLVKADIKTADPDYLNGDVSIRGLQMVKEGQKFTLDTIDVHSEATAERNLLSLKSEILNARVDGKYQLTNLAGAVINQINKYYAFGEVAKIPDQRFRFDVKIHNPKFIKNFVPSLTAFSPSYMNGLLDTQKDSLVMNAWFPQVVYGDYKVDSTRLTVNNDNNQLNYKLLVGHVQSPSLALYNTELSGQAVNNLLGVNLFVRDSQLKDKYRLAGTFKSINKDYQFSFDPDKLLLDYQKWAVAPENYLQFGASGILAHQFNLSQGGQLLSINSSDNTPNSPLKVEFKNFRIETLTKFAAQDTALAGGNINGTVDVKDLTSSPKFTANLTVDQLRYQKDQLGTLRIAVNNNTANAFETNIALSGVHELRVNGFYYTNTENALDLTLNIDKIDLKAVESLSMGQIRQGSGTVTGQMSVKGAIAAPKVLGELKFNQAAFNAAYVNSYFRIPDETVSFTNTGITFDSFTILDSLNQKAIINGGIRTTNYSDFRFNMDISTDNFRALNSTAVDNDMIYGTVFLTSNIKVRGDLNQPDVNMNIRVNKGTKFYFAVPTEDPSVIDQDGIVQFIDADAAPYNGQKPLKADSISKAPIKGINLTANVVIDSAAELNVVVDPQNGDILRVKGNANLTATMDPSGKTSLTGRYQISEGSYRLTVAPLGQRPFKLVSGSSIVWTGDPMSANVNLTALYEVNAAPIDLINEPDNVQAKTKLPFQVYLMMKDELLKPTISFRLDLPENERGALGGTVYTKLLNVNRDENELNKQVFALLALNRFIANNPFQSLAGGGGGVSTLARSSVSKLLTEQLNNLASDLIQGVQLNFGVNSSEDYSTGALEQKTDLEVGLSKRLLNDRLTVTVGSSFGIEGPQTQSSNSTNIAGNVNIEYAVSADGRYRLRAYRRNQNDAVIQGQIIETGLGFALVVDYNKFREIFRKRSKRNNADTEQKPKNERNN